MAENRNANLDESTAEDGRAKDAGTQPSRGDVTEGRGGVQEDQIVGETAKGARNNESQNRNPQGNPPDQNQSARQEGDTF